MFVPKHFDSFSGPDIHSWLRPRVTRRSCGHYRQRRKLTLRVSMVCAPMRAKGVSTASVVCVQASVRAGGGGTPFTFFRVSSSRLSISTSHLSMRCIHS